MATAKIVRGFHGTTLDAAKDIVRGNFRPATRTSSWLGYGRYFFQDGPTYAEHWAKVTAARSTRSNEGGPAVVAVDIDIGQCLDLIDGRYWEFVRGVIARRGLPGKTQLGPLSIFLDSTIHNKSRLGFNYEDCHVMNAAIDSIKSYYKSLGSDITTVRGAFIEGLPLHQNSWLFSNSCLIISVLDKKALASSFQIVS